MVTKLSSYHQIGLAPEAMQWEMHVITDTIFLAKLDSESKYQGTNRKVQIGRHYTGKGQCHDKQQEVGNILG